MDDPVVHHTAIDHEGIRENPYCVVATTNHGGHLGYREGICDNKQWFVKVCSEFYTTFLNKIEKDCEKPLLEEEEPSL
jgi:predicted alpha/beta-fold hydrolase